MILKRIYNLKFITLFIILQPLLDIITYLTNNLFGFSAGLFVRGAFLIYEIVYLLFVNKKDRKYVFVFFLILVIFILAYLVFNELSLIVFIKSSNSFIKFIYFPITLLFFYNIYINRVVSKISTCGFFIALFMLIAQLIGGTILSYESAKLGNSGWFFSANELSGICSIIIPIVYAYFIRTKSCYSFITFILLSFSMLLIGTKTAYLSIGITLLSFLVYFIIKKIFRGDNVKKQLIITAVALLVFVLITPITYAYKNIYILDKNPNVTDVILSGRDQIEKTNLSEAKFNIFMGIKSETNTYYEFERDYYNLYYNYGLMGCVVFFFVPVLIFILNYKQIRKYIRDGICSYKFSMLISLFLAFSVAYISGHILFSPAVSIYICILFSSFLKEKNENKKKNVVFISSVGGHLTQMLELKQIFKEYNYVLITESTPVTRGMKEKYNMNYLKYGSRKYIFKYLFISIFNIIKSLYLFIKYDPDSIVTTGTHTAVPICYIGWFTGKNVIYIESFAKRTSPTLTGRIVYPIATTFVVQWKSMMKFYPKAEYWGAIY